MAMTIELTSPASANPSLVNLAMAITAITTATDESEQHMTAIEDQRQAAIQRLGAKREFRFHLGVFILVNTMLIIIWASTGGGYFWPIWPIGGWGIGLAAHAYNVYFQKTVTEDQIQAEMRRQGPQDTLGH